MIIPSINRATFEEAAADIAKAEEFVPAGGFLHVDVADGHFTSWRSWGNPAEFQGLDVPLRAEVHLMVDDPEAMAVSWMEVGAKRLVVPVQKIKDIDFFKRECAKYGVELMLSFDLTVPIEGALPYMEDFQSFHVLAVHPGRSGQGFEEETLGYIKFLREAGGGVKIEVDGGVDVETGAKAVEAGADILVSGDYIFNSEDPAGAFKTLNSLIHVS
ncbi:MAG: hypothetical protein Q8P99_00650 [bacterium]|nr:hypothetical protein [bacterium]